MKKPFLFTVFCLLTAAPAYAGQIQISTYYPSPFGYYERLKFNPRLALTEPCEVGTVYYLSGTGLKYCAEDTTWKNVGGSVWNQLNDNISPIDTTINPNLQIGIGTDAPTSSLHVYAPEGYTPAGVFLDTADIDVNGGPDGQFRLRNNSASGTQKMFFSGAAGDVLTVDTQAGRVGIGTTTPGTGTKLTVSGSIAVGIFNDTSAAGGVYDIFDSQWLANADKRIYTLNGLRSDGHIDIEVGNIYVESGKVAIGLGSAQPNNWIQVQDLINFDDAKRNTALGYQAGKANTTGTRNTSLGYLAGTATTSGFSNTFLGSESGQYNTTGQNNTFVGSGAGGGNTGGSSNVFLGWNTGANTSTGGGNVFLGTDSGASNATGSGNIYIGFAAGAASTTGQGNICIGQTSCLLEATGNSNIIIGASADTPPGTTSNVLNIGNAIYGDLSTGKIGIGTTAPATKLEVSGGAIKATGGFILETRTTNPGSPAAGQMWVCTDTGDATPCNGI